MVHDEAAYLGEEFEYVDLGGAEEDAEPIIPVGSLEGGRMWGADEAWGGYDAGGE
jgi:hypothetical protein